MCELYNYIQERCNIFNQITAQLRKQIIHLKKYHNEKNNSHSGNLNDNN